MVSIKEFFGVSSNKGVDCQEDENGRLHCRAMIRHRNQKLSTGSEATISVDQKTCKAHFTDRYSVFDDDEEIFQKALKKAESDCRGGIN